MFQLLKVLLPDTEEEVERHSDDDEPFSALAFKVMTDPYVGKLNILPCVLWYITIRIICT